jgi:hypothetical protein
MGQSMLLVILQELRTDVFISKVCTADTATFYVSHFTAHSSDAHWVPHDIWLSISKTRAVHYGSPLQLDETLFDLPFLDIAAVTYLSCSRIFPI